MTGLDSVLCGLWFLAVTLYWRWREARDGISPQELFR